MVAKLIDGQAIAKQYKDQIKQEISLLKDQRAPKLVFILIGDNPASKSYIKAKSRACEQVGITSHTEYFKDDVSQAEVASYIETLNGDTDVDGILLQLPLPEGYDTEYLLNLISPNKDVDGLTELNMGRLLRDDKNASYFIPCTPLGCMKLIESVHGDDLSGLTACVIGRSNLIGKPVAALLTQYNATVIHCHSKTKDIQNFTRQADILVSAVGQAKMVKQDWVKENASVIDVGVNQVGMRNDKAILVGDSDFKALKNTVKAITPVPKGVGPMTIAMLLNNCLEAYKRLK